MIIAGTQICWPELEVEKHGGGCCGRFHISNFPEVGEHINALPNALADKISNVEVALKQGAVDLHIEYGECDDEDCITGDEYSFCAEVVLVDSQLDDWQAALLLTGFKKVHEFRNSNSGNMCHVFFCNCGNKYA